VPPEKAQSSISSALLATLIAMVIAVSLFLLSTQAPERLRVLSPRAWIRR
jgi:hypothetical protein